ncbi:MAG TPA: helix-turn-helix domain-containing protein [Gemmataceae bacterium]|nr:helix-turn-helix domain-containing protein [Gemmataceae bacterium]
MTVKQAAEQLGVSTGLIYAWCRLGVLAHERYGMPGRRGVIRIREEDLAAFAEQCRREPLPLPDDAAYYRHVR